jgi:hypothetical protein
MLLSMLLSIDQLSSVPFLKLIRICIGPSKKKPLHCGGANNGYLSIVHSYLSLLVAAKNALRDVRNHASDILLEVSVVCMIRLSKGKGVKQNNKGCCWTAAAP